MECKFILKGLDCANCAEKIRAEAERLNDVESARMNFLTGELTLSTSKKANAEKLYKCVAEIVSKTEPDVKVLKHGTASEEKPGFLKEIIKITLGFVMLIAAVISEHIFSLSELSVVLYIAAYCICAYEVAVTAYKAILKKNIFNENTLMLIASVGAGILGEYAEAVAVMLFYSVGELFQSVAVNKSRRSIASLISSKPDTAELLTDDGYKTVSPESVPTGSIIRVKPGEKIPLDGIVQSGSTSVNTAAVTGESLPADIQTGDNVTAGTINMSGVITVRTTRPITESAVYKMIEAVQSASERKTRTENFITVFAKYYTPAVTAAAVLLSVIPPLFTGFNFADWIERGLIFLVISCPCALVISVPMGYFAGIGRAHHEGILVRGSTYLEAVSKVKAVFLDKTGTLTKGEFEVTKICAEGISESELLRYAAHAENGSNHPIALSVKRAYGKEIDESIITECKELAGKGVFAKVGGKAVLCANRRFMAENGIECPKADGTALYIAIEGKYCGYIEISDSVRENSAAVIEFLRRKGIKTVMLTGDSRQCAESVAKILKPDEYYAELLPNQKSEIMQSVKARLGKKAKVLFLGDGINDASVIASADVGAAMGGAGADCAIETADLVLMRDDPLQLCEAYKISAKTNAAVLTNIIFALSVKFIIQLFGVFGLADMWAAVFADVGVSVIAVLNSLRVMVQRKKGEHYRSP